MIFDSENIMVNCQRLIMINYAIFHYICIQDPFTGASLHIFHSKTFHSLVYSGGWFFYFKDRDRGGYASMQACACADRPLHIGHGAIRLGFVFNCTQNLFLSSVAFLRFTGFRSRPTQIRRQQNNLSHPGECGKNSIPENFPQCMQCPRPDNMRPCKAIFCFIGRYPVGNNGLSLGRLVHCTGLCWSVVALWFYREEGAITKK